jgi:hypothetical protein
MKNAPEFRGIFYTAAATHAQAAAFLSSTAGAPLR